MCTVYQLTVPTGPLAAARAKEQELAAFQDEEVTSVTFTTADGQTLSVDVAVDFGQALVSIVKRENEKQAEKVVFVRIEEGGQSA